ncbi:MAG: hypothetical protein WCQ32_00610 [bacterium]
MYSTFQVYIDPFFKKIEDSGDIPPFLKEHFTKDYFFSPLFLLKEISDKRRSYLFQHGIFFLGQVELMTKDFIKTFVYDDLQKILEELSSDIPNDKKNLFMQYSHVYQQVRIFDFLSEEELIFLKTNIWNKINPDFEFSNSYTFGEIKYRRLLNNMSLDSEICITVMQHRKFHLLKFFEWISKQKVPQ